MEKLIPENSTSKKNPRKPIKHAKFEFDGYPNDSSEDYLEAILETVCKMGLDPMELIFSGVHDALGRESDVSTEHPTIYGMNEAAWRELIKVPDGMTAATYANQGENPRIILYDRSQLALASSDNVHFGSDDKELSQAYDSGERMTHSNITKMIDLVDMSPDEPASETMIHKDYPHKTPSDAIVGIIELQA